MRHREHRPAVRDPPERARIAASVARIERRRGFVEHENRRDRARAHAPARPAAARRPRSGGRGRPSAYRSRAAAARSRRGCRRRARPLPPSRRSRRERRGGCSRAPAVEEQVVLEHDAELRAPRSLLDLSQVDAVDEHRAAAPGPRTAAAARRACSCRRRWFRRCRRRRRAGSAATRRPARCARRA